MRPERILVINPNTTVAVTERFVAEARLVAPPGTIIDGITATGGPAIVSTAAENRAAAPLVLDMLVANWRGYDAVILAISFDTGLIAARCLVPVPVIGIMEASLKAAAQTTRPLGLLTYGTPSRALYEELVRQYGMTGQVLGIETIEAETASAYLSPSAETATSAISRLQVAGAQSIVICGAALAGAARRWQSLHQVPLIDAAEPAVRAAVEAFRRV